MEHGPSFFERVIFNPKDHQTLIGRYFTSIRTIVLIILTLSGSGLVTYLTLPRELNPSIKIPIVFVATAYPGASPDDIESLITMPIEDAVSGLKGVSKVTSSSNEGASTITIEFASGTDPDQAKQDIQSALDTVNELPEDTLTPSVQVLDFQNQPVINFIVTGNTDTASLQNFSDILEERLKDLSSVEKVALTYRQDPEISIILDSAKINALGLNVQAIAQSTRAALQSNPGGSLDGNQTSFSLSQDRSLKTTEDIRHLPLTISDTLIPLGEVAQIEERPSVNAREAFVSIGGQEPTQAITFSVFKTDGADATATVTEIRQAFEKLNQSHQNQFILEATFDGSQEIKKSFDQLFHDFFLTVALVFVVLILFFGLRQSIVASLAIPLTFLVTFIVMGGVGMSINFIALFALLIALGILVDNAIVIISAMASYERTGKFTPSESALLVWRDFRSVIFITTITTVWAFLPLLLATGIIGDFIKPIPIVVSSALAISAAVALFIVIPMMAMLQTGNFPRRVVLFLYSFVFIVGATFLFFLIPSGPYKALLYLLALLCLFLIFVISRILRNQEDKPQFPLIKKIQHAIARISDEGIFDFHPLALRYQQFILGTLTKKKARRTTLAMLILFTLFSYLLIPTGFVVNEFFPQDNQDVVYVSLELPQGTPLKESRIKGEALLNELKSLPETRLVLSEIGASLNDDGVSGKGETNHALFTLLLQPKKERSQNSSEIVESLSLHYKNFPLGKVSVNQQAGGPPAGSDLQIKLLGEDSATLNLYAEKIEAYLQTKPGVSNISQSIDTGSSKIVFVPNQNEIHRLNISESESAFWIRMIGSGFTIKEDARFGEEKRDISLYLNASETLATPENLSSLLVPTPHGPKPLHALGKLELAPNPTLITREDGKRTLSVSADVADGYSPSALSKELGDFADNMSLPDGYSWKTGGANEENQKSVTSILEAMLLSAALIFGTMVIQFNSFRKALIVILVIPLAVSGVFIVFAITGIPLSFPALIGVLALFGIVVNNSIILVDKINRNMDAGLSLDMAIAEGSASRLEPILLTALTTIIGLIPITLSDPIWQGLGGAIIAGLLFSGIAKLFFIPVMYKILYGEKED
ncbi:MAG: efflux RND transporter permease subunit [Candidatus Moranbacteria bacterium]|nr:efflux RND transporter permease subunit [Candidatus Moranbacteria bacterium]